MMMDKTCLLVKNLPDTISDINQYFRMYYGAINIKKFGRRRAIIKFPDECTAKNALYRLHQNELENRILSVEYVNGQKSLNEENDRNNAVVTETDDNIKNNNISMDTPISNFLKKLYGINSKLNFNQPPPPYLKYYYPKINRSILDSISIALLTVPKFYIQVLHLMNRMNLDPPFLPLNHESCVSGTISSSSSEFILKSDYLISNKKLIDAETQTDCDCDINIIINDRKRSSNLLSSDESELESDDNDNKNLHSNKNNKNMLKIPTKRKRKKLNSIIGNDNNNENDIANEIIKNKFKKLLIQKNQQKQQQQQHKNENAIQIEQKYQNQKNNINEIFENNNTNIILNRSHNKIEMNVNNLKLPEFDKNNDNLVQKNEIITDISNKNDDDIKINNKNKIITDDDLKYNRIKEDQLKELPLFKNYKKGDKTNKLYIKNLNKNVTEDDLKMIYNRYTLKQNDNDKDTGVGGGGDGGGEGGGREGEADVSEKNDVDEEIHIKLMQYGRMKGQAFITFNKFNDNNGYDIVEKALNETNGYILKNKPMIVCFGKKCN